MKIVQISANYSTTRGVFFLMSEAHNAQKLDVGQLTQTSVPVCPKEEILSVRKLHAKENEQDMACYFLI